MPVAAPALCFRRMIMGQLLRTALLFLSVSASSCPQGEDLLKAYAYTALTPPSSLFTVGAIVAVEDDGDDDINTSKLKLICGPRASMGEHWTPLSSETVSQSMMQQAKNKWAISADLLGKVRADAHVEGVKSIQVVLQNARLMQISDADVLENLQHRSEDCRRAVQQRLAAGHVLSMVSGALVADMQYKVEFESKQKVDAKTRVQDMQRLAASMGGGQSRIGQKTIESRGLALGIKTDTFLLALSVPDLHNLSLEMLNHHQREVASPHAKAKADPTPDAQLVLPPGSYLQPVYSTAD